MHVPRHVFFTKLMKPIEQNFDMKSQYRKQAHYDIRKNSLCGNAEGIHIFEMVKTYQAPNKVCKNEEAPPRGSPHK